MNLEERRVSILEKAAIVDDESYRRHMVAFVKSFVRKEKQQRWLYLLLERPRKARQDSHKLLADLTVGVRSRIDREDTLFHKAKQGVFYEFWGDAKWLAPTDALDVGDGYDAIFSIEEGNLAVFFFHHFEIWLCKLPA